MRITIKALLISVVATLVLFLGVQGVISLNRLSAINYSTKEISTNWLASVRALGEIRYRVTFFRLYGVRIVAAVDAGHRHELASVLDKQITAISQQFAKYETTISSAEERRVWNMFKEKWAAYVDLQAATVKTLLATEDVAMNSPATIAVRNKFSAQGPDLFNVAAKTLEDDIALNDDGAAAATRSAQENYDLTWLSIVVTSGIALAVGVSAIILIIRRVTVPVQRLNGALDAMSKGNLDIEIPGFDRRDEIGDMAKTVLVIRQNAERKALEEADAKALQDRIAADQRRADMHRLANDFEGAVGEVVQTVSSAATELEASARSLASTAERTEELSKMVASAADEASTNVQSVASASEEMASSVNEISRQVQESARIASDAVTQAQVTNDHVSALSRAADRIGDVVELINNIAGQTNLLALNATIEAARAGEAGRGFAVVASEVKTLAEQTAKATGEIAEQVKDIQSATGASVDSIKSISSTIVRISEIASTIASAVEEQGAATQEISRNVQQASRGTSDVASNITDVQRQSSETGSASSQVLSSAQSLSTESNRLSHELSKFLDTVRAA